MAMVVRCPNKACGKPCLVSEEHLGRTVHCPHCKQVLSIPTLETATLDRPPPRQDRSTAPDSIPPTLSDSSARETPPLSPTRTTGPGNDLPERLGRFQVRACLGAGSFGTVYLVYDPQLDREMALKVPQPGTLQNPQAVERFLREARAAGRLHHPHIVPVFEASGSGSDYYIASAYVPGRTLEQALSAGTLDFRQAARTAHALAEALAYAHRLGIVHRDVKPSNVLLDEQGEAYLMDFGLAYRLYAATKHLTHDGMILGTPAYMAPEQAAGRSGEPQPASDQYSLGVVLYEMLTRQTPFSGTPQVVLYHTLNSEPPAPRALNPEIPVELERICLKTMARRPEDRYPTCQDLADDLRQWLKAPESPAPAPPPVPARPPQRGYRRVLAALAVLLLATAAGLGAWLAWRSRDDARRAHAETDLARYRALVSLAGQEWLVNNGTRAEDLLDACPELPRGWEWHYLKNLGRFATHTLSGHAGPVTCIAFSADGKRVISGGGDRTARVWDVATGKELLALRGFARPVRAVGFSPDGKRVFTATGTAWALPAGEPVIAPAAQLRRELPLGGLLLARLEDKPRGGDDKPKGGKEEPGDPREIIVPQGHGDVRIWDAESGKEMVRLAGPVDAIESAAFGPDGTVLALGSSSGTVELWDLKTNRRTKSWQGGWGPMTGITFNGDGKWLAFGSGAEVRVWKIADVAPRVLGNVGEAVRAVAFDPGGERVAAVGQRGTVRAWPLSDLNKPPPPKTQGALGGRENRLALAAAWHAPVVVPSGPPRNVWGASSVAVDRRFADEDVAVSAAALSADGQRVAAAWGGFSDPAIVTVCAGHTGGELRALRGHAGIVAALAFGPDGQTLASACTDGTVKLWWAARWLDLPLLEAPVVEARGAAFSGDGKLLAVIGRQSWGDRTEQSLKVWDARGGLQFTRLGPYEVVAFSPDGRRVAVAGGGRSPVGPIPVEPKDEKKSDKDTSLLPRAARWNESLVLAEDKSEDEQPLPKTQRAQTVQPPPIVGEPPLTTPGTGAPTIPDDGVGAEAGMVLLIDARTGQKVRALRGHKDQIGRLVFSPDGRRLAALSQVRYEMREEERVITREEFRTEVRTRKVFRGGREVEEQYTVTVPVPVEQKVKVQVRVAVGGEVTVWDTATGRLVRSLPRQGSGSFAAAFSPDGERLAISSSVEDAGSEDAEGSATGEIKVWDLASGNDVLTLSCEDFPAWDLCYSPDGRRLAATAGQRVKVWDMSDGELRFTLAARRQFFGQVAFSPDGERLVTVGRAGSHMEVRAWDAADGTELVVIEQFPAIAAGLGLTFATDGHRLLFAGKDQRGLLQLWAWDGAPLETRVPLPNPPRGMFPGRVMPAPERIAPPQKMPESAPLPKKKMPPDDAEKDKTQLRRWRGWLASASLTASEGRWRPAGTVPPGRSGPPSPGQTA